MAFRLSFLTSEGHCPCFHQLLKAIQQQPRSSAGLPPWVLGVSGFPREQSGRYLGLQEARGPAALDGGYGDPGVGLPGRAAEAEGEPGHPLWGLARSLQPGEGQKEGPTGQVGGKAGEEGVARAGLSFSLLGAGDCTWPQRTRAPDSSSPASLLS